MSVFNFTDRMRLVCEDMVIRVPELQHIDLSYVGLSFAQARNRSRYGMFASLTPLRFQGGVPTTVKHGHVYRVQQVRDKQGREMLYILTFYLPRFQDLDFREKLVTILHELWHISPDFNGDIRRHPGRCYAHSHSQAEYDVEMGRLADRWLAASPPPDLYQFLFSDFTELSDRHGRIVGTRYRRPLMYRQQKVS
ncbi:MAG: putative metallopeptidase [Planctomycetota bacterium]